MKPNVTSAINSWTVDTTPLASTIDIFIQCSNAQTPI